MKAIAQDLPPVDLSRMSTWASSNLSLTQDVGTSKAVAERGDVKIIDTDLELSFRKPEAVTAGMFTVEYNPLE